MKLALYALVSLLLSLVSAVVGIAALLAMLVLAVALAASPWRESVLGVQTGSAMDLVHVLLGIVGAAMVLRANGQFAAGRAAAVVLRAKQRATSRAAQQAAASRGAA